ncbi:MAG: helicase-related protein [Acidimicrobiales bacterium]
MSSDRFDPAPILSGLKDFQRASVEHAFRRLYADDDAVNRFLVADEVGLGKTMVARGLIARTVEHLWNDVERIDVVYVCSNRTIAEQNVRRLNILGEGGFSFSSRMTMIAKEVSALRENKVNFVSFTPGTSFDLKSNLGTADERILLWHILRKLWGSALLDRKGSRRVFQGWIGSLERFDRLAKERESWRKQLDGELVAEFGRKVEATDLRPRLEDLADRWRREEPDDAASGDRNVLVGELRNLLAACCVDALEPDLVILDEFQRFRDLLTGESEAGALANSLFDYPDNRTLLLSATPYKMYTASGDGEDDHHRDFVATVGFLLGDDRQRFEDALAHYRELLLDVGRVAPSMIRDARTAVEHELRRVMTRTERLGVGADRNGMLVERAKSIDGLRADDIRSYVALERLSVELGNGSMTEYWKSAPYFLNFTDGYKLDGTLTKALGDPERHDAIAGMVAAVGGQIDWPAWRRYEALDGGNARLRDLMAHTTDAGRWRMLWLAPSMPDYELSGPWVEPGAASFTKRLIFSAWAAVPKAIASLVSYDAERRIMALRDEPTANTADDRKKIKGLLQFRRNPAGEPAAMTAFGMLYPSWELAEMGDPVAIAREFGRRPGRVELEEIVRDRVQAALDALPESPSDGREDDRWYWAAPLLLDARDNRSSWMAEHRLYVSGWHGGDVGNDQEQDDSAFADHVRLANQVYRGEVSLGRRPADLQEVLIQQALGNPAVLALRSLVRIVPEDQRRAAWDAAARIGWGFRTLFNLPESSTLIRSMYDDGRYWQEVLRYAVDGGLGAVLDEYIHCLREWLGIIEFREAKDVKRLAEECTSAVSLKASDYVARDHLADDGGERRFRSRFALRFGDERSESDNSVVRSGNIRTSFNSPFWPFVLASTSVGQEGLDFHLYCHAIVHWNLPSNPVDLEQREGRVHRFKGHAIRLNVAERHAGAVLGAEGDPWKAAFDDALAHRDPDENDLVPYWVYPGSAAIERYVPALPLSREVGQLAALKRSVALYRLVFGQPRQDDLVEYLAGIDDPVVLRELRIDLSPRPVAT